MTLSTLLEKRSSADVGILVEYIDALRKEESFHSMNEWVSYFRDKLADFITNIDEDICTKIVVEIVPEFKTYKIPSKRTEPASRSPAKRSKIVNDNFSVKKEEPQQQHRKQQQPYEDRPPPRKEMRFEKRPAQQRPPPSPRDSHHRDPPNRDNHRDKNNNNRDYQPDKERYLPPQRQQENKDVYDFNKFKNCAKNKGGHYVYSVLDVQMKQFENDKKSFLHQVELEIENIGQSSNTNNVLDSLQTAYELINNDKLAVFKDISDEMELNQMSVQLKLTPLLEKWLGGMDFSVGTAVAGLPLNATVFDHLDILAENQALMHYLESIQQQHGDDVLQLEPSMLYTAIQPFAEYLQPTLHGLSTIEELAHLLMLLYVLHGNEIRLTLYSQYVKDRIFWISGFAAHVNGKVESYFSQFPHTMDAKIVLEGKGPSKMMVSCIGKEGKELSTLMEATFMQKKMVPGVGYVVLTRHNKKIQQQL